MAKMMKHLHMLGLIGILLFSCNGDNADQCMDDVIAGFGNEICTSGASVIKYSFQDNDVYVIQPGNCIADGADTVLDADCNIIGSLSGFAGVTDVNGENFYDNAIYIEIVWQN